MSDPWASSRLESVARQAASRREAASSPPVAARLPYLALLLAVAALGAYLLTSPAFVVGEPRVVGQRLVAAEAIGRASGVAGRSIFLVDPRRVERAVVDLRPIKSAKAVLAWPNSVMIEVVEREPFATWRGASGAFLVSDDGIILAETQGTPPPLTIDDLEARRLFVGGQVDAAVVGQAGALRDALKAYQTAGATFEYSASEGLAASLELPGSAKKRVRVLFGQAEDVDRKIEVWSRIAPELSSGKLKADLVDLRIADRPYVS